MMEVKLFKIKHYYLYAGNKRVASSEKDTPFYKLSLENCQEIEHNYNLEKLLSEADTSHLQHYTSDSHELVFDEGFKLGMQAVLDIFISRDEELVKKLKDLRSGLNSFAQEVRASFLHSDCEEILKTLRPIEWGIDVEVETEDLMTFASMPKEGENRVYQQFKFDAENQLILKRKLNG